MLNVVNIAGMLSHSVAPCLSAPNKTVRQATLPSQTPFLPGVVDHIGTEEKLGIWFDKGMDEFICFYLFVLGVDRNTRGFIILLQFLQTAKRL